MSNKILSNLNIGNNSYEIDDAFARQKIEEVDNNLSKINPVYSTSGSVVSFNDGADNLPLDELIVDINPVQDLHGYDAPWPGGGGKNLFGLSDFTNTYFGVTYAYESLSGKLSTNGTCTAGAGTNVGEITVPEGTYTFSADFTNASGSAQILLRDKATNANVEEIRTDRPQRTVTLNGTYYIRIAAQGGSVNSGYINNIQLELGESKTNFAPYSNICPITGWTGMTVNANGTEIPISWESEAGTVYGGTLDVLTGVLTVDRAMITATEFYSYASGDLTYGRVVLPNALPTASVSTNYVTSKFPVDKSAAENTTRRVSEYAYFYFPAGTTREYAESVVNGTQIVYPVADPITYQLTPHEIRTLLGQNNIFTDINSKNILVSYKASILKYIDKTKSTIFFGQCDPTSTATKFTAQIDGITEYFDGLTILLKNGAIASAAGCTFNINGLGEKGAWGNYDNARLTTLFAASRSLIFIYDSTLDEGNGGFWWYQGKDSNDNTVGYAIRTNYLSLPVSSITYRYRLLFTSADKTHYVPANNSNSTDATAIRDVNQEKIDPFGEIVYYSTTTVLQAEGRPSTANQWLQYNIALGYSFNRTGKAATLTLWKPVYVKATPYVDGSAIIDADEPYVQDLPTTEDGKIYIYLGIAYSATNIELSLNHPVYYCYNGAIRPWLGFTDSEHAQDIVSSVNGKTGTITLTAEDIGAMEGMTIFSYGHSTWAEFEEAYEANRIVYCKASSATNPATGQQGRMAFLAYVQFKKDGYNSDRAEFQYYRSVSTHTDAQQGDQVFCYVLTSTNGGTWSVETRQASSRVVAGTGLSSAYTTNKVTLSLDTDYKNKIDTLWADYQSRIGQ